MAPAFVPLSGQVRPGPKRERLYHLVIWCAHCRTLAHFCASAQPAVRASPPNLLLQGSCRLEPLPAIADFDHQLRLREASKLSDEIECLQREL